MSGVTASRARAALFAHPAIGPTLALLAVSIVFSVLRPDTFLSASTFVTMSQQTVIVAIAAVGMTLVIVHGGIDLSVGSAVALTTVVVAHLLKAGYGPGVAALGGVAAAGVCGLVTGAVVTQLRVAPFIVTLGMMSILRGTAKGVAKEQKIDVDAHGLDALLSPPKGWTLLPAGVWIALVLAGAAAAVLRYTRFGRHVYAVGSSERTALLCGVDVPIVRIAVYTLSGLLVGVAGVMEFSYLTVGDPTTADGLELDVIAAVVIGGASLSGGEGSIAGSIVGAFFMTVIRTGCLYLGLPNWVQQIVTGAIIVIAASVDRLRHRRS